MYDADGNLRSVQNPLGLDHRFSSLNGVGGRYLRYSPPWDLKSAFVLKINSWQQPTLFKLPNSNSVTIVTFGNSKLIGIQGYLVNVKIERNDFGQPTFVDLKSTNEFELKQNSQFSGLQLVEISDFRKITDSVLETHFAYRFDAGFHLESIQPSIAGISLEPLRFGYDLKRGIPNSFSRFLLEFAPNRRQISGDRFVIENFLGKICKFHDRS